MAPSTAESRWSELMPSGSTIAALERFSFSDEAARRVAATIQDAQVHNVASIGDVWKSIREGKAGVVPFENSTAGVVWPHLAQLRQGGSRIVGEVDQSVRMCVGAREGVSVEQATMACSHPKGMEQTGRWLSEHPQLAKNSTFDSTVDAVRFVAEHPDIFAVALASRDAITEHGLIPVAEDIADNPAARNITRMFLVQQNGHSDLPNPASRHHAAVVQLPDYDGSLHDALGIIRQGAGLSSIHSRNIGHMEYEFFLQMRRRISPDLSEADSVRRFHNMVTALHALLDQERNPDKVLWLGSWDQHLDAQV